jgi:hypothetical protein
VGFVVDKVVLGQVSSEYFGFPCQSLFHQLLHNHPDLSSGACTIGPEVAGVPSVLSPTPLIINNNKYYGNEDASSSANDVGRYVIVRKLVDSIFNILLYS